jgi:hypothetical protein
VQEVLVTLQTFAVTVETPLAGLPVSVTLA